MKDSIPDIFGVNEATEGELFRQLQLKEHESLQRLKHGLMEALGMSRLDSDTDRLARLAIFEIGRLRQMDRMGYAPLQPVQASQPCSPQTNSPLGSPNAERTPDHQPSHSTMSPSSPSASSD